MKKNFNVYQRIVDREDLYSELKEKIQDKTVIDRIVPKAIIGDKPFNFDGKHVKESLDKNEFNNFLPAEEAIIEIIGRPVLEISNGTIDHNEPELDFWKQKLKLNKSGIETAIASVGRIELKGHPKFDWIGTGWLYNEDYIITNRHVAKEFARRKADDFVFKKTFWGGTIECYIDFKEEFDNEQVEEYKIDKIMHIEPDNGPDIAVLKIKWKNNNQRFPSLELAEKVIKDESIATIGYPARDSRTRIPEEQLRIFSHIFNKKRLATGEIDFVDSDNKFFVHDCTTLGGNSGSPVIDIESQKVYGLHFSGREGEGNYAVSSQLVEKVIKSITNKTIISTSDIDIPDLEVAVEKRVTVTDLKQRNGYNKDFLNEAVPFPELSSELMDEVARFGKNDKEFVLKYTNYSVIISAKKRLALVTGVNIDGKKWRHVVRGSDSWQKDPRIAGDEQVGNELYKYNKFDRGHLVRRLDPAWGDSYYDAKFASDDTFFYTNCAPQHKNLNQDIWLDIEEHILSNAKAKDMKVSVFNGSIFSDNDMFYRNIQIPESFWKVVITNSANSKLHATAYLLSQKQWLDDIESVFGAYRSYQVPVSFIQENTGLTFHDSIIKNDPLYSENESVFGGPSINEIKTLNNIVL